MKVMKMKRWTNKLNAQNFKPEMMQAYEYKAVVSKQILQHNSHGQNETFHTTLNESIDWFIASIINDASLGIKSVITANALNLSATFCKYV